MDVIAAGFGRRGTLSAKNVIDTIPADQLPVVDVAEGWEPLCTFLDVPVPDEPSRSTDHD